MEAYHAAIGVLRTTCLLAGSFTIFLGILRATPEIFAADGRVRVARMVRDHVALGLEFFVAATLLNLILNPSWAAVAATAVTIAIRQVLTYSLRSALR